LIQLFLLFIVVVFLSCSFYLFSISLSHLLCLPFSYSLLVFFLPIYFSFFFSFLFFFLRKLSDWGQM